MAKLYQLLTENEKKKLSAVKFLDTPISTEIDIKSLSIEQLSQLSFILIETEHNGKIPECVLSAEAINILTRRAIKQNIAIF